MEYLRYVVGGFVLLVGVGILVLNGGRQISNYRNRNRKESVWSSPVPLIGPLFCILGYKLLPVAFNYNVFWVFLLDADTLFVLVCAPVLVLQSFGKKDCK